MKKNKNLLCGILLLSSFSAIAMEPSQSNSSSNSSIYFEIGTGVSMNSGKDAVNDYELNFNKTQRKTTGALSAALGYIYSPNIRFDLNVTYIPEWNISESTTSTTGDAISYSSKISSLISTINAYYDFERIANNLTPYVMGGIGLSRNKIDDMDIFANDNLYFRRYSNNSYNFAWKLGAGAAYKVNDRVSIDLGYRFVSLGKVSTKSGYEYAVNQEDRSSFVSSSDKTTFKNLYSHQIMISARLFF